MTNNPTTFPPLTTDTVKLKDFKYAAGETVLAETATKQLIGRANFNTRNVVYRVQRTGHYIVQV